MADFAFPTVRAGAVGFFGPLRGPRISTTRAEGCAALLALLGPQPQAIGIDNKSAFLRVRQILARRPPRRPWALTRDGDLWEIVERV
eukprot:3052581-Alexandrium_andersonii.AAC.1